MTERIGLVKNPLTIIAIFAGIAEVSGTIVLPFISEVNQATFVYFLIWFPILLVVAFFLTLNFNSEALYAPSDFRNEDNYLLISRYDVAKREKVTISVPEGDQVKELTDQISQLNDEISMLKIQHINRAVSGLSLDSNITNTGENIGSYNLDLLVSGDLPSAQSFVKAMSLVGYKFFIYKSEQRRELTKGTRKLSESAALWIGNNIPLELIKKLVDSTHHFYPHIKYLYINGDREGYAFDEEKIQYFVGGSTETAIGYAISAFTEKDFQDIKGAETTDEFFRIIRAKYNS